jgi:hypothetical protein
LKFPLLAENKHTPVAVVVVVVAAAVVKVVTVTKTKIIMVTNPRDKQNNTKYYTNTNTASTKHTWRIHTLCGTYCIHGNSFMKLHACTYTILTVTYESFE